MIITINYNQLYLIILNRYLILYNLKFIKRQMCIKRKKKKRVSKLFILTWRLNNFYTSSYRDTIQVLYKINNN